MRKIIRKQRVIQRRPVRNSVETLDVPETRQDIRLFTKQKPGGQAESVIPLQWSISPEAIEEIVAKEIRDPHMLISVECDGQEKQRYVVPLKREMVYVQFSRSGRNVIHATIVGSRRGEKPASQILLKKHSRSIYEEDVLERSQPLAEQQRLEVRKLEEKLEKLEEAEESDDEDILESAEASLLRERITEADDKMWEMLAHEPYQVDLRQSFWNVSRLSYEAQLEVDVPKEMFAQKPEWMTRVSEIYSWDHRLGDQCDLRKRVLITLVTLPFYFLFKGVWGVLWEVVMLAIIVFGLILGWRGGNFRVLKEPIEGELGSIWRNQKPSVWLYRKVTDATGKNTYVPRSAALMVFNPPMLLLLVGVTIWASSLFGFASFPVWGIIIVSAVTSLMVTLAIWAAFVKRRGNDELSGGNLLADQRTQDAMRRELATLAELRERNADVSSIKRPSMDLIFQDVKSKVCRPFER